MEGEMYDASETCAHADVHGLRRDETQKRTGPRGQSARPEGRERANGRSRRGFARFDRAQARAGRLCVQKPRLPQGGARKARRFERAFSCQIPEEVYDQMEEELRENE